MSDERTKQPTAKRRKEAREQGRVVASPQITAAVTWLLAAWLVLMWSQRGLAGVQQWFERSWSMSAHRPDINLVREPLALLGVLIAPVLLGLFAVIVLSRIAQTGFVWVPQRLVQGPERMNPINRLNDLFSGDKLFQLVRGVGLLTIVLAIVVVGLWRSRESLAQLAFSRQMEAEAAHLLATWGLRLGGCLAVFAILDYLYQRYRFEQSLQMSSEELRAEIKAVEGNPQVAAGRRQMQQQLRSRPEA